MRGKTIVDTVRRNDSDFQFR